MRYGPKSMQINTNIHFSLKALLIFFPPSFDLLVLQNMGVDYMIRNPERNLEELHFFSCFSHVVCSTTDTSFILFVYQVSTWKTQTAGVVSPLVFFCLPGVQHFLEFFEKSNSLLAGHSLQLSRIVHKKTKIKQEGNTYSACTSDFRLPSIYQL